MLRIHSIETLGANDGPGLRMVVFTQGCHMRCVYCHNPDTLDLNGGRFVSLDELVERAVRQKPYFNKKGGVTISGGEPTIHRVVLRELFVRLHAEGIHTCLDTNGLIFDEALKQLYAETDLVMLDIKHIDDQKHRRLTGQSNLTPLAVAAYREQTGKPLWLRYVLVPGWTDDPEDLKHWAAHFANYKSLERVEILPYHPLGAHKWKAMGLPYALEGTQPPSADIKQLAFDTFSAQLPNVILK